MAFVFAPRRRARRVWAYLRSERRTLRQGFVALIVSTAAALVAGVTLGSITSTLAALPGLVGKEGSHTAGNSPGVNDGAGALVLASDEWAKSNGRAALATIVTHAQVADDFPYLARTPANAAKKALEQAGLKVEDTDLTAAQPLPAEQDNAPHAAALTIR